MAPCQVADDYYKILGVLQSAGKDAIRTSYKRLALLHHPDRNPNNPQATARFQQIEAAYSTLFDPERRRIYDLQYASIRHEYATGPNNSRSDPPPQTNNQNSEAPQIFKLQIEKLEAALLQLRNRRIRLDDELFETKRECNRSQAALDKLQGEAVKDALEESKRDNWLGYFFNARESEEEKQERQRRMVNNRVAQTVREAELQRRRSMITIIQLSIDDLDTQIQRKQVEKTSLQQQERTYQEAFRWAEMLRREALQREREMKEREDAERLRREQQAERIRKQQEEDRLRREQQAERVRKQQEDKRLRREQQQERVRKQQEDDRLRMEREAERIQKIQEDDRLRREREAERIQKIQEDDRLRREREAERIQKIQEAIKAKIQETIKAEEERLQKAREEKWDKGPKTKCPERQTKANQERMQNGKRSKAESRKHGQSARTATGRASSCLHKSWWDKEEGKHECERCLVTTSRFTFRCPSCRMVACADCRNTLKGQT
ncbi:hypothetical protein ACHAQJ_010282 [Trichoderma viride]